MKNPIKSTTYKKRFDPNNNEEDRKMLEKMKGNKEFMKFINKSFYPTMKRLANE